MINGAGSLALGIWTLRAHAKPMFPGISPSAPLGFHARRTPPYPLLSCADQSVLFIVCRRDFLFHAGERHVERCRALMRSLHAASVPLRGLVYRHHGLHPKAVFFPLKSLPTKVSTSYVCLCVRYFQSDASSKSDTVVDGGQFTGCKSTGSGAFMFASVAALVTVLGGTVKNSVASKRAGRCGEKNDRVIQHMAEGVARLDADS